MELILGFWFLPGRSAFAEWERETLSEAFANIPADGAQARAIGGDIWKKQNNLSVGYPG